MKKAIIGVLILGVCVVAFIAWQKEKSIWPDLDASAALSKQPSDSSINKEEALESKEEDRTKKPSGKGPETSKNPPSTESESKQVVTDQDSILVLVNKQYGLSEIKEPKDLVYPNVHFIFKEKIDKRKMRKEAASALEELFAGARKDGIYLGGVSAYRSNATQKSLFNRYVQRDGEEQAMRYSAVPGHSEHETGLAIDVSDSSGKCAATDCFADTKEAKWLAKHAPDYGFIIRYPQGKEAITGYKYEAWHIRYVGTDVSRVIARKGITLEEYFNAVPVMNK